MRRVPGLRREEVAQLANVGLTWYTWLATAPDLDDLVQGFEPWPAYAISSRFDVLAHNRAAALLFGDLRPGQSGPANMMHLGFTDPAWHELIVDWEQEAARHVAMYRAR